MLIYAQPLAKFLSHLKNYELIPLLCTPFNILKAMAPVNISETKKDNQTPSIWKKYANINSEGMIIMSPLEIDIHTAARILSVDAR